MLKKRILFIILAVALAFSFAGCIQIQRRAVESGQPKTSEPTATATAGTNGNLIPLSVFTSSVEYTPPQISEDGTKILYRHMTDTNDSFIVEDIKSGNKTAVQWPQEAAGIPYYSFLAPDGKTVLFFVDDNGDEDIGLYTSNTENGETKTILPAGKDAQGGENCCYYVSEDKQDKSKIYLEIFNTETKLFDLYRVNYYTGEKTLVLKNPGHIESYTFDYDGILRAVTMTDEKAGEHVWIKNDIKNNNTAFNEGEWKEILNWDYEAAGSSGTYGIMPDGKSMLYMDSSTSNTASLYQYDLATGKSTLLYNDPNYDISNAWTDLSLDKVTAVTTYSQKIDWHVLDSSFQDDYDVLSKVSPNFDIVGSSDEDRVWIVEYVSDTKETDYYVYDMASKKETFLYNSEPELENYKFASMEPFSYTSKDGLKIEGYATFPAGSDKKNLPTVMLVHGGPWLRDTWGYNSEVQFLASRGYLVLQVNFRGSSGYGKDFMLAGDKEWGGKMHQDILDAVNYSVSQGWTDKDKVGVYGGSYGGYEALCCAAFSSDVFKSAVDMSGPSDLVSFMKELPDQWSSDSQSLLRSVGDPGKDTELMKQRSPLNYASNVKIPMLIVQGVNDMRVKVSQADNMVNALKDAGAKVDYLRYPDTGHGLNSTQQREEFFTKMEKLFANTLGGMTDN